MENLCTNYFSVEKMMASASSSSTQQHVPGLQAEALLRLEHGDIESDLSLSLTLLTGIILSSVWKEREAGTVVKTYKDRADLEQYINLLRTTRLTNTVAMLDDMLHLIF